MSKVQAVNKAAKLWKYIHESGVHSKAQAYTDLGLTPDICHCPLCDYAYKLNRKLASDVSKCTRCPVNWGTFGGYTDTCLSRGSPYAVYSTLLMHEPDNTDDLNTAARGVYERILEAKNALKPKRKQSKPDQETEVATT